MRSTWMKLTTTTALSLGLLATPALADMSWDNDSDGMISESEFHTGFDENAAFDDWDSDGDGMLSEDEFASGFDEDHDSDYDMSMSEWDEDDDGAVSQDEWNDGWFSLYDDDGNSEIDDLESAEMTEDFDDEGIFGS